MRDPLDYQGLYRAAMHCDDGSITEPVLSTLGGYTLLARIGEGGMGLVWRAQEPETGRIVALKQLRFIVSGARFEAGEGDGGAVPPGDRVGGQIGTSWHRAGL